MDGSDRRRAIGKESVELDGYRSMSREGEQPSARAEGGGGGGGEKAG